jgi:uncharacterized protein
MEPVFDSHSPYTLNVPGVSFYAALQAFADEFMERVELRLGPVLEEHGILQESQGQAGRSAGEYAVELLTLGLLRREYGALAGQTPQEWVARLAELWELRSRDPQRKTEADQERAAIFLRILSTEPAATATCTDARLAQWLQATGEFVQEALRITTWLDTADVYWSTEELRNASAELAEWFVVEAKRRLGIWTAGVECYTAAVRARPQAREDLFLITRSEALYHLNMLGSEIMNRGFAPAFAARKHKVLLVPGCMRERPGPSCRAHHDGLDIVCAHCHPDCAVSRLDRLGQTHGFRVFIVPHASSFTAWLRHWQQNADTALVAAACPLHLVPGGYEMRALGLAAQCVLLEYSGCRRHWDPQGTPTRLNTQRLLELTNKVMDIATISSPSD